MQSNVFPRRSLTGRPFLAWLPILAICIAMLACNLNLGNSAANSLGPTQTAISLQMTSLAVQIQPTQTSGPTPIPLTTKGPSVDFAATSAALAAQLTATAQALELAAPHPIMLETPLPPSPQPPVEQPTPLPPSGEDLKAWMSGAAILVYEDMVTDPTESLYVKDTLKSMGLKNVKWDGNAMGWFKSDLLSSPNGKPWDLVIIAAESRDEVSGEYFDYLSDVLNQGTSVIMESWYLDDVSEGKISPILSKCGITVYPYVPGAGSINDVVIYPLSGGSTHPVLNEPNRGLSFTQARDTWLWSFDLGSQMAFTGQGDAQLLLGTDPQQEGQDATLAVCQNGQITLQTFSSHSFPYRVMYPLWENMIYNALRVRFSSGG